MANAPEEEQGSDEGEDDGVGQRIEKGESSLEEHVDQNDRLNYSLWVQIYSDGGSNLMEEEFSRQSKAQVRDTHHNNYVFIRVVHDN